MKIPQVSFRGKFLNPEVFAKASSGEIEELNKAAEKLEDSDLFAISPNRIVPAKTTGEKSKKPRSVIIWELTLNGNIKTLKEELAAFFEANK